MTFIMLFIFSGHLGMQTLHNTRRTPPIRAQRSRLRAPYARISVRVRVLSIDEGVEDESETFAKAVLVTGTFDLQLERDS